MSDATGIQWTDATWNPVRGCARVSAGCAHCYAERVAHRFSGPGKPFEGLTISGSKGPRWTGKVTLVGGLLDRPLRWRKPRRIFVNSMSDLFHEDVPEEFVDRVFAVMAHTRVHTYQILTKRPKRMLAYMAGDRSGIFDQVFELVANRRGDVAGRVARENVEATDWPLPNVWLGVSCENQEAADERIPILLETPAAVRFVSAEPLLGPINLYDPMGKWWAGKLGLSIAPGVGIKSIGGSWPLHWVIVGGESGPRSRACDVEWVRSIVGQCRGAGVPLFVKQLGARPIYFPGDEITGYEGIAQSFDFIHRAGADPSEWPEDLRVREFPR